MARREWYHPHDPVASVSVVAPVGERANCALVNIYTPGGSTRHWIYQDKVIASLAHLGDGEVSYAQVMALVIRATSGPGRKAWLTRDGYAAAGYPLRDQSGPRCPACGERGTWADGRVCDACGV